LANKAQHFPATTSFWSISDIGREMGSGRPIDLKHLLATMGSEGDCLSFTRSSARLAQRCRSTDNMPRDSVLMYPNCVTRIILFSIPLLPVSSRYLQAHCCLVSLSPCSPPPYSASARLRQRNSSYCSGCCSRAGNTAERRERTIGQMARRDSVSPEVLSSLSASVNPLVYRDSSAR
jgi:hypothetical protein